MTNPSEKKILAFGTRVGDGADHERAVIVTETKPPVKHENGEKSRPVTARAKRGEIVAARKNAGRRTGRPWLRDWPKLDMLAERVHPLMDVDGLSFREANLANTDHSAA